MQDQLLTKCPHCGTTFRLSKEHLEIAGGAVRCGSCYQVFHAKEHIVKTSVIEEVRQEQPAKEDAPDPFEEFELDDSDPYEDTPDWNAEDHPDADLFNESYPEDDAEETLKEFGLEPEPEQVPEAPKKSKGDVDESWAEALLEEIGEDIGDDEEELIQDNPEEDNGYVSNTGFSTISSSGSAFEEEFEEQKDDEFSDTFKDLDYSNFDDRFGIEGTQDEPDAKPTDESWAQKMLEELESDETAKPPSLEELSILDDTPDESDTTSTSPFGARDLSRSAEDAITKAREKAKEEAKRQREKEKLLGKTAQPESDKPKSDDDGFFGEINDEELIEEIDLSDMGGMIADERTTPPQNLLDSDDSSEDILEQQLAVSELHFGDEGKKPRTGLKTIALVVLNIVAILGLVGQHAYFNFDELARQDAYRPYYRMACQQLGCTLPTRVDVSKIQGTNLIVRSHPMEPNALVIDAIVYNRAKYPQPYPDLKLAFADINGKPIASRRFKPQEYIQDKNIDFQRMPANTPVHLTLEIVDPGEQAVNYQIDFLAQSQTP